MKGCFSGFQGLLFLLALSLSAQSSAQQARTFQDWLSVPARDGSGDRIAITSIDGNSKYLAVRCFVDSGLCASVVNAGTQCEVGGSYPILVNSSLGALSLTGLCTISDGRYELALSPYSDLREMLDSSGMIGFAVPLASGLFSAVRFSLRGSTAAVRDAENVLRASGRAVPGSEYF